MGSLPACAIPILGQPQLCCETVSRAASTLPFLRLWVSMQPAGWLIIKVYLSDH